MRTTRIVAFLLGGLVLALIGPSPVHTQPGPGGPRMKGGGKKFDPSFFFNRYSGGADSFDVNKLSEDVWRNSRDPQAKEKLLSFLEKKGVKNGVFTRELFTEYWDDLMVSFRAKGGGGAPRGGPPGGGGPITGKDGERDYAAEAKKWFEFLDKNKDGSLDRDEVGRSPLARDFDKWDKNKDGKITLEEYTEYYKDNEARRQAAASRNVREVDPDEEIMKRPVVYHYGNLPKDLPPWFEECDTDKDGQVGLYEWLAKERDVKEFLSHDLNGDGFITVEEVLRIQKAKADKEAAASGKSSSSASSGSGSTGGRGPGGPGQGGGPRMKGKGKGKGGPRGPGGGPGRGPGRGPGAVPGGAPAIIPGGGDALPGQRQRGPGRGKQREP